jgi:LPS-assembly lipoprotein
MSSRNEPRLTGLSRRAFALAALLTLGGCFEPMYGDRSIGGTGTNLRNALRDVEVAPIEGRVGQELRNDIIFELGGGAGNPVGAPYRLHLTVATNSFSAILDPISGLGQNETLALDVVFRLKDVSNDKFVMTDKATARVTVDTTAQRYARMRAIRDAENKAAQIVSEHIRSRIASYFLIKT